MKAPLVRWLAAMILALCPQGWCLCAMASNAAEAGAGRLSDLRHAADNGCCWRCPQSPSDQDSNDDKPCGQCDGSFQPRASFDDVKTAAVTLAAFPPLAGFAAADLAGSSRFMARAPLIRGYSPQTLLRLHCALVI